MAPSFEAYEVAFELMPPARVDDDLHTEASLALQALAGVLEVYVDVHATWALVTYDPLRVPIASIVGCLADHGLSALRMRILPSGAEPREDVG